MFRASVISAFGALVKLIAGFVLLKLIAMILGPDGLGLMGQFMSLSNVIILLAGGGISTGIIKYVAEYSSNTTKLAHFMSAVSLYAIMSSGLLFIFGFIFTNKIGFYLFGTNEYNWLILLLFVFQFGMALNNVLLSWVSGHKDIVGTNVINVSSTVFSLFLLIPLSYFFEKFGLLAGLAIVPAFPVIISFLYVRKKYPQLVQWLSPTYNKEYFMRLGRFSLMLIVTVTSLPLVQMILRNDIVSVSNWGVVGYWQAAIRLSDASLLCINMVLANYYMPKLSELGQGKEQIVTVWRAMLMMMPIIFSVVSFIWILRDILIPLLFSDDFIPSYDFIYHQLMGDVFKMLAYIVSYFAIANAMTKISIIGDITQASLFYFIAQYFIAKHGAIGVAEGYTLTYVIYFIIVFLGFSFYSYHKLRRLN
ncbi:lipid III flippase [Aeromonas caviae]|uniref:O-antigen translocase n=1 Tax=Aeromonas caviae TaxID=648 RepID=UPI001CC81C1E|nr:O-antigen translocase [Aeromonas caviae]GJC01755.1 lipid III flippase [Aeromonas caviae]GKQ68313.1 lipid III flippase [Aeromonas caviae]